MKKKSLDKLISGENIDELPMMKNIMCNFVANTNYSIEEYLSYSCNLRLDNTLKVLLNEYTMNDKHLCIAAKFEWNASIFYFILDKQLIYKILEIALGGKTIDSLIKVENRVFSRIEQEIINEIIAILIKNIQDAFRIVDKNITIHQIGNVNLQSFNKLDQIFLTRMELTIKDLTGQIDVLIPYDTILPIKSKLIKSFSNVNLNQNDIWKNHLKHVSAKFLMKITAEISLNKDLSTINNMKVGDTLITEMNVSDPFELKVNGYTIFHCKIGKLSSNLAIELVDQKCT